MRKKEEIVVNGQEKKINNQIPIKWTPGKPRKPAIQSKKK
jgi:hypothetical protein